MVDFPKPMHGVKKRFEADARQLVPVTDEIGGTVIYLNGRPAYYVLYGEWFQAVESGAGLSGSGDKWPASRSCATFQRKRSCRPRDGVSRIVSTYD